MLDIEQATNSFGLLGSLKRMGATAVSILHNRIELIAIELKEEKTRAISMAIWSAALVFLGFMTLVAAMVTLLFVFWEQRLAIMGGFCGFFALGAVISFVMLKSKLKTPPFAETIAQLKKDREWLKNR